MNFKALIILILLSSLGFSQVISQLVTDNANIISEPQKTEIEQILKHIYDSGKAEFAVVTISSLEGKDIESVSLEIAQGVIGDKETNNGLLLLIAVEDRQYRFEVGRGLEGDLPDITVGRLGREFLEPNFRSEEYGKGIKEAVSQISAILLEGAALPEEQNNVPLKSSVGSFIFSIIFLLFMIWIFSKAIKSRKSGRATDSDYFLAAYVLGSMLGRGKGGFGGGFGGFGGGSFGGGGASGGW